MKGPINFVFTILWFGIGLAAMGTLKDKVGSGERLPEDLPKFLEIQLKSILTRSSSPTSVE